MNDDYLVADDDEFLDRLAEELLANDAAESTRFTHAFVNAPLPDVVKAIRAGMKEIIPLGVPIFGVAANLDNCRAFLTEKNGCSLIWLPQSSLHLATVVSAKLLKTVHWISVFESYKCRAYLRIDDGECTQTLLDPIEYWTQNILDGEGLIGKGVRTFNSYSAFKSSLINSYIPTDEYLDFERVECEIESQGNELNSIGPIISLDIVCGVLHLSFIGNWTNDKRRLIESVFA